jgi:hypothetical protein
MGDLDVGFAEDHEQVARAGFLQQVAHRQVGVHAGGQDRQVAVAFGFFRDVRVEGESADDQQIESDALDGFFGGFLDQLRANRAVFRADADGGPFGDAFPLTLPSPRSRGTLGVGAFAVDPLARVGLERIEAQPLVLERVLDAGRAEVVQDHVAELVGAVAGDLQAEFRVALFRAAPLFLDADRAVGREAFDGERPGDSDPLVVFVGLIDQRFGIGAAGDRGVDFALPLLAGVPPLGVQLQRGAGDLTQRREGAKAGFIGFFAALRRGVSYFQIAWDVFQRLRS